MADSTHKITTIDELYDLIDTTPIIDHHAHALFKQPDAKTFEEIGVNTLLVTSEANGKALDDSVNGLPHHRALLNLSEIFGIPATWEAWKEYRRKLTEDELVSRSLEGIETILIDDGLRVSAEVHENKWHDKFVKSPTKRILRIETLAEDILKENFDYSLDKFEKRFIAEIEKAVSDEEVVGFKTVICYRTGLEIGKKSTFQNLISTSQIMSNAKGNVSSAENAPKHYKIQYKPLNDRLVEKAAKVIVSKAQSLETTPKPLQFHTGLGDNDLTLQLSNPALLQPFIKENPELPIVLLHSGYPFTREAGYLATTYENVYLDFGEIFPAISANGQEAVLKQVLELTPSSKVLWSTDGHLLPETYLLATKQIREAFKIVANELIDKNQATPEFLGKFVTDSLFETANKLYGLGLKRTPVELTEPATRPLHKGSESLKLVRKWLIKHPDIQYFRLNYVDYSSIVRTRVVTKPFLLEQLEKNEDGSVIGLTKAGLFLLADCSPVPGCSPVGEYRLVPDFTTIHLHPHLTKSNEEYTHASVFAYFNNDDGKPLNICPRFTLQNTLSRAKKANLTNFKIGWEIEFNLFRQEALDEGHLVPITSHHTWTTSRSLQSEALDIIEEVEESLRRTGIQIQQFHSEAASGQFELILPPLPPLQAADTLLHTRETLFYIASKYRYRASLIPKPFPGECGTASHLHISFEPKDAQWSFFAGILEEIRAVSAITLGGEPSYDRVSAGTWAGGLWGCWGRQNREAPVRLVEEDKAHWEVKCVDGLANPYLALAAVITAGVIGVEKELKITGEVDVDAGSLTEEQRLDKGIHTEMPKNLTEALESLIEDLDEKPTEFSKALGADVVKLWIDTKRAETRLLKRVIGRDPPYREVDKLKKRVWLAQWY